MTGPAKRVRGTGHGGEKRRRKAPLPDTSNGISMPSIRGLARRGGIKGISDPRLVVDVK